MEDLKMAAKKTSAKKAVEEKVAAVEEVVLEAAAPVEAAVEKKAAKTKKTTKKDTAEKAVKAATETAEKAVKAAAETAEKAKKAAEETAEKAKKAAEETAAKVAKKAPARKKAPKVSVKVQYLGREADLDAVVEKAQAAFAASYPDVTVNTFDVYVKPEEGVAYYVVNGEGSDSYKVEL